MQQNKTDSIWYSPLYVFNYVTKLINEGYDIQAIEKHFKILRESKALSVLSLALAQKMQVITMFQPTKIDPPDGYLRQDSKTIRGQANITTVEITHYYGANYKNNGNKSLLDQLIRTNKISDKPKYSDEYILLIELLTNEFINYDEIREYTNTNKIPYPLWTLKKLKDYPDTIAELIIINPITNRMEINVGEAAYYYNQNKVPAVMEAIQVENPEEIGYGVTDKTFSKPPWVIDPAKIQKYQLKTS